MSAIQRWWQRYPQANIGMPTGQPRGCWVLDVDPRHGGWIRWNRCLKARGRARWSSNSWTCWPESPPCASRRCWGNSRQRSPRIRHSPAPRRVWYGSRADRPALTSSTESRSSPMRCSSTQRTRTGRRNVCVTWIVAACVGARPRARPARGAVADLAHHALPPLRRARWTGTGGSRGRDWCSPDPGARVF